MWAQPTLFLQYRHLDNDDSSFYLRLLVYRQLSQYLEGQSSSRHLSLRVWNWLDPVSKMGSWIGELLAAVSWKCKTPAQGKVLSILGKRLPSYTQWRQCLPGIAESNLLLIIPPGTPGADFPLWLDSGYCQVLDPFWPSQSPLTLTWVIFNLAGVSFLYLLSWWDCSLTQEYKNTFRSQIIVCVCVCVCLCVVCILGFAEKSFNHLKHTRLTGIVVVETGNIHGLQYWYFFLIYREGLSNWDYPLSRNLGDSKKRIQAKGTAALLMNRETKSSPQVFQQHWTKTLEGSGVTAKLRDIIIVLYYMHRRYWINSENIWSCWQFCFLGVGQWE